MKVEKLLKRFKIEFVKVNLIQASLDSILFFLTSNLILFLFSVQLVGSRQNYLIVGGLTFLFFVGDLFYRVRNYHLEIYEEQNPELQEVLRTARDNLDKSSIASQALFDELMDRARSVTSESIIPSQEIIKKIIAIGVLCFLTVGSGLVDFQLREETSELVSGINLPGAGGDENETEPEMLNGSEILGESSEIEVTNRDLAFNISGTGEGTRSEFSFDAASQEFSFESVNRGEDTDLELAKQYSLAIKDFE